MSDKCRLAKDHPHAKLGKDYYRLSGTSMSAAQVSGVVALVLSRSPGLTPDEVKYRLLASARPAATANDTDVPAFSPWQQGAGRVDAFAAVFDDYAGTANLGLDIDADLAGTQHYVGYTRWDAEAEQFYLEGAEGYTWGGGFAWSESYLWGGGFAWSEAYAWNGGFAWSEAYTWGDGFAWSEAFVDGGGFAWSEAAADLVIWVPDE
jgi:serine protease AprX